VGESKHFVTDSDDNPENPDLDATPPRPRPTAPLAERREGADGPTTQVHYAQAASPPGGGEPRQMVTHTWDPATGTWRPATRSTGSGTVRWNQQTGTWDPS
jgi:hypothetical protein